MNKETVENLTNNELITKLYALDKIETETVSKLLLFLGEIDKRKLYLEAGYSSLFSYCTEKLGYSENIAYSRITVCRLIRKYPVVQDYFLSKKTNLTNLSLISRIITPENIEEILSSISGKTKREVELFIASYSPEYSRKKILREKVKPVVVPVSNVKTETETEKKDKRSHKQAKPACEKSKDKTPEMETRFELKLSVDEETFKAIERVKELLSGKYPEGVKLEHIIKEGTSLFLDKNAPERKEERRIKRKEKKEVSKIKESTFPRKGKEHSRNIAAEVKDEVYLRDGGQCTYVSDDGVRCNCRHNLHIDHIIPFAKGGSNNLKNLRLLCRQHNMLMAEKEFGTQFIKNKMKASS